MIELFGSALVTFLVIIDPPGCAPIFASLTRGGTAAHRRAMAIRSSLIAWAILMFFAVLGKPLLQALGISLASFRIAGGIMLFFIAIDMVFERRTERREKRESRDGGDHGLGRQHHERRERRREPAEHEVRDTGRDTGDPAALRVGVGVARFQLDVAVWSHRRLNVLRATWNLDIAERRDLG